MSDWSGGYSDGSRPANAKIPVKVHRNVSLIRTGDAYLTDELLARGKVAGLVVGRFADDILLVRPGKVGLVVEELRRMGHTPQVVPTR